MNAILTIEAPPAKDPISHARPEHNSIRQTFVLRNRHGLHCRPSVLLVKTLEDFGCSVTVESNGVLVDGRSILGLLSLAAGYGTRLTFVVSGPDAKQAMATIQRLFEDNFAEAYEQRSPLHQGNGKFDGMKVSTL